MLMPSKKLFSTVQTTVTFTMTEEGPMQNVVSHWVLLFCFMRGNCVHDIIGPIQFHSQRTVLCISVVLLQIILLTCTHVYAMHVGNGIPGVLQ